MKEEVFESINIADSLLDQIESVLDQIESVLDLMQCAGESTDIKSINVSAEMCMTMVMELNNEVQKLYEEAKNNVELEKCIQNINDCVVAETRKKTFEEVFNKIDEGVCDLCEHNDMEDKCYKTCSQNDFEKETFIAWLKEQVAICNVSEVGEEKNVNLG